MNDLFWRYVQNEPFANTRQQNENIIINDVRINVFPFWTSFETGRVLKEALRIIAGLLFCFFSALLVCCENFLISGEVDTSEEESVDYLWSADSHGEDADPHYTLVFDDTIVHRIDITISSAYFQEMEEDMESLYGSFGSRRPPQMVSTVSSAEDPVFVPVTVSYEGNTWPYVGMRYKGNSSLSDAWMSGVHKLPFRLNFEAFKELYPETDGQRFWGFEKLTFSNGKSDDSLIRDKMASDLFQQAGIPAAEAAFYRVYIDTGSGPVYWGLYTMLEDPSDAMLYTQFSDGSGNLYKPDDETHSTLASFDEQYQEDYYEKKTNEEEADWSDIESFIYTLNDSSLTGEDWQNALEAVFDVEGYLEYLALNNTLENWDVYGEKAHNYYLYSDPSDNGVFTWFPWDMNESFSDSNMSLSFSMDEVSSQWPLIRNIMDESAYQALYESKLNQYFNEESSGVCFDPEEIKTTMEEYSSLIEDYVIGANGEIEGYTWFSSDSEFTSGLSQIKSHIEDRFTAVSNYLDNLGY